MRRHRENYSHNPCASPAVTQSTGPSLSPNFVNRPNRSSTSSRAAARIGGAEFTPPSRATKRPRRATAADQAQAAHALVSAVIESGEASTNEVHRRYELPPNVEPRVGAVTTRLLAEGVLRRVGDIHTRRSVAHGRRIGRYVAVDGNCARQYRDTLATAVAINAKRSLSHADNERFKIARPGFEPGLSDSESLVLPLHHQAMFLGGAGI